MRTKTTLFLAVLLAALGAIAYWILGWPTIDPDKSRGTILAPQEAAQLDYLKFESSARPQPIVLEKANDRWRITDPVNWPANIFAVERLVNQLQFLKKVASFPAERLADYGLDPAEGTLTYGFGAARRVLRIGKVTDLERNVYLLPDDRRNIIVVRRSVLDDLQRPLEELRSDAIFTIPLFEVRNWFVQIAETGNTRVHLVREGENWRLDSPIRTRADKAAVDTLLKSVLELRVDTFSGDGTPDLNDRGLVSPAFRITVVGSGNRDSLLLGNPVDPVKRPGVYYAKLEDDRNQTVFTVQVDVIDELRNAQVGLRDRHVVDVDPSRLQSLTLSPAGQPPITLQKLETGAWQVQSRTPDRGFVTMDGDPGVIKNLVQEVVELRAVRDGGFVSDAPSATDLDRTYGLTGAAWQIQIAERAPGGNPEVHLQNITLGRHASAPDQNGGPENLQYARADEGFVYLVDRGLGDDLRPEPYHYRNRLLRKLAPGESITALTLTRLASDEVVFSAALAGPDQTWKDALITQAPERREAALALLNELRILRAANIVAPEFPKSVPGAAEMRPWTWLLEATIAQEGGARQQTTKLRLYLDAYAGGTELMIGVPDLNLAVGAETSFIDAVRPLIFPRPDPGLPPDNTEPAAAQPTEGDPIEPPAGPATPPAINTPSAAPAPAVDGG